MEIAFRTATGWSDREKHHARTLKRTATGQYQCPKCPAPLFSAPHGGIYCDAVHEGMETPVFVRVKVPHRDASIRHYQSVATKQLKREHPRYKSASFYGYHACEVDAHGTVFYVYSFGITQ